MLRKGPLIFLLAALMLALAATWAANQWIRSQAEKAAAKKVITAPVVVAAGDLDPGKSLELKDLAVLNWPGANLPAGHFAKPEQIKGRVVRTALNKGEVILPSKLAQEGLAGGLSAVVPEGYRAMTVHVDEVVGVGGFVQPGDRVDVLVTMARGPFNQDPVSRLVLQDLPVLTVGEKFQEEGEGSKAKRRKVTVVTLQVKPQEGERLALISAEAKIILALRNQGDHEDHNGEGVRFSTLAPAPPTPPAKHVSTEEVGPRVEVIRVAKRRLASMNPDENDDAKETKAKPPEPAQPSAPPLPKMPTGPAPITHGR